MMHTYRHKWESFGYVQAYAVLRSVAAVRRTRHDTDTLFYRGMSHSFLQFRLKDYLCMNTSTLNLRVLA